MGTILVVELEVGRQTRLQLRNTSIILDVDVFVFGGGGRMDGVPGLGGCVEAVGPVPG
jgi:hypothetical protein